MTNRIDRRTCLKSASLGLALPLLESLVATRSLAADNVDVSRPQRLVCVGTYLGFHQADFFPQQTGAEYEISPVLKPLSPYRKSMTVFSGLDHRGRNGHEGWKAWMTGKATGSVSLDQVVASHVGHHTRYASLQLTCGRPPSDARLSFTPEGVALPMIGRPSVAYQSLFGSGSDKERIRHILTTNQSVLDDVLEEANAISRRVTARDSQKLDEYLASVRDVEKKLQKQQDWINRPTPKVDYKLPEFDPVAPDLALECETIMYDLMALALTTDSTRVITFLIPGWSQVFMIDGQRLSAGYHGLSHHGNDPDKIAEYNVVGTEHVRRFGKFVKQLTDNTDSLGRPLLDSTAIVFGSGMGDSNTHDNSNLPTLLAGGGFNHGQHQKIDRSAKTKRLLGDLYLTLMQQFGVDINEFAGATNNMDECLL